MVVAALSSARLGRNGYRLARVLLIRVTTLSH
jgi:hypothetical protein